MEQGTILFNRYEIVKGLGEGGTSVVYLARNIKVGSLVAIKIVEKDHSKVNLLAEKNLLKELRHSAIPIIIDIEEDNTYYYLVEEYVEGALLNRFKLQLPEKEVVDLMLQLCDVLAYLHTSQEEAIIYRDMKPDNIIRMDNGRIKLIDFGIAIKHGDPSQANLQHYGTKGYAAPEQLSRSANDERTDIFSLGVCIYFMLTGKNLSMPPYRLRPIKELCHEIDPQFAAIITKCIETIPAKRYQNIEAIKYALIEMTKRNPTSEVFTTLKNHTEQLITVAGVKRGIGTTHICLMMAYFFAKEGKDVAYIELAPRDDVMRISTFSDQVNEGRYSFQMHDMTCFPYLQGYPYEKVLNHSYDVILIDAGTTEELNIFTDKNISHMNFIVIGSKAWELDFLESYYFDNDQSQSSYLLNLSSESQRIKLAKSYQIPQLIHQSYNPNPFRLSEETEVLYQKLFRQPTVASNKMKMGVKDELKAFIKKCQKQLKTSS